MSIQQKGQQAQDKVDAELERDIKEKGTKVEFQILPDVVSRIDNSGIRVNTGGGK